jgi:phosphatidylethanolamine/phosphatidyl-N-methylethanolamine N-methyltransferase
MFTFLREFVRHFHDTGAVAPSSRWLARALTAGLTERPEPQIEILEAGPGTGAVTTAIVRHLQPGDRLTLCEVNAAFVAHLEGRLRSDPRLSPWREQITVHHGPVENLEGQARFHHVVCGLPFNNFEPALVRRIFDAYWRLLRAGGTLSFFEYFAVRQLKAPLVGRRERARLRAVGEMLQSEVRARRERSVSVFLNIPPARAHVLRR